MESTLLINRPSRLILIAGLLGSLLTDGPGLATEPLKVTTSLAPGPYFVGQAIEIRVEAAENDPLTRFEPSKSASFEIKPQGADPDQPAIGRFLLIPKRSGSLEIPGFRAKSGDRSGSSRPTRLTVANIPVDGRTPAFLGGVGTFEIHAEAEPTTLRAGQTFEYRIKLSGPASWSSDRSPDLTGWTAIGGGFRVEALPSVRDEAESPSLTFRYRLRPRATGRLVLPPVAVAAFDPRTRRFATRATSGIPIVVERPPTVTPETLNYEPNRISGGGWPGFREVLIGSAVGVILTTLGVGWLVRRIRRPRRVEPAELALELARNLDADLEIEPARRLIDSLTLYLERVDQRTPGALTPPEAGEALGRLTGVRDLGEQAERLVIACDRANYRDRARESVGLIDDGKRLFESIAAVMKQKGQAREGPREAVETA